MADRISLRHDAEVNRFLVPNLYKMLVCRMLPAAQPWPRPAAGWTRWEARRRSEDQAGACLHAYKASLERLGHVDLE